MSQNIVLVCPNCETRFSAAARNFLPRGRQVRCSQCQHVWFHPAPMLDDEEAARHAVRPAPARSDAATVVPPAAAVDEASPKPRRQKAVPEASHEHEEGEEDTSIRQTRRRGAGWRWLTWLLWLIALLLLLAILAYVFREPLRRAAPEAVVPWLDRYTGTVDNTAQGLVGATRAPEILTWQNIHYDIKEYDGLREVLVQADLLNTHNDTRPAPKVRVRLVDGERESLHASIIGPEDGARTIAAGASTRYFVRIPEPPADFEAVLLNIHRE